MGLTAPSIVRSWIRWGATIQEKIYVLINVYAPNKDKELVKFFDSLLSILTNENLDSEENIVLGGDLNCPLNPLLDKKGGIFITKRKLVTSCIDNFQGKLDLVDIWRIKHPDMKSFTWSQKSPRIFCRLDYWLISNNLGDFVGSTEIVSAVRTDHDAISLEFGKLENELKGLGIWKMNCSLLDDEEYVNNVTEFIPIWIAEGRKELSDDRIVWDWLKYNIRVHAMHFSQRKAKERNEMENNLQNELNKAKRVFENNPTDLNATYYNDAREKLENFLEVKIRGVIVRARARWHEHGEKSNKYFLNLEKRNHIKKHIRKLLINDIITTDPLKILKEQECFYNKLYKSNGSDTAWQTSSFLNSLNIPKLSEEQKTSCEGKISSEECFCILENF